MQFYQSFKLKMSRVDTKIGFITIEHLQTLININQLLVLVELRSL